ncbi:MAG: hypothetical protein HY360_12055 [Verrucomicrobia bacterium]|nr:hypothetical protein [Verrucomicrobiota bacterium]
MAVSLVGMLWKPKNWRDVKSSMFTKILLFPSAAACLLLAVFLLNSSEGADPAKTSIRKWETKADFERCTTDGNIEIADRCANDGCNGVSTWSPNDWTNLLILEECNWAS